MEVSIATILVYRGKAYLPVQAKTESGLFVAIDPIYIASLNEDEILSALESVRAAGHPSLSTLTADKAEKLSPLLRATKAKSFRQLARDNIVYMIEWSDKGVMVDVAPPGDGVSDVNRRQVLMKDALLKEIVQAILKDWGAHS